MHSHSFFFFTLLYLNIFHWNNPHSSVSPQFTSSPTFLSLSLKYLTSHFLTLLHIFDFTFYTHTPLSHSAHSHSHTSQSHPFLLLLHFLLLHLLPTGSFSFTKPCFLLYLQRICWSCHNSVLVVCVPFHVPAQVIYYTVRTFSYHWSRHTCS